MSWARSLVSDIIPQGVYRSTTAVKKSPVVLLKMCRTRSPGRERPPPDRGVCSRNALTPESGTFPTRHNHAPSPVPRVERTSESHKTEHAAQNTSCGFPVPHSFRT
eukprot:4579017-Prymnesium_polylepis.1